MEDPFRCPVYGRVTHDFCHENYVLAHAPEQVSSPCFRCRVGTKVRMTLAPGRRRVASRDVVDGAHAYYTESRQGRGHDARIAAFVAWMHRQEGEEDEREVVS